MYSKLRKLGIFTLGCLAPVALHAQFDFKIDGRNVQVHSFASQGFAYSNDNNFLTMKTTSGSFGYTDGGGNISTQVTDKFRVGAQVYFHKVGHLGDWRPQIDWATADYRFRDWFGIRGGKVKTVLGLYNDVQDMEFLHTWALVPQSVYPVDQRDETIAHIGADLYGNIGLKNKGSFSYTVWGGKRPSDSHGGAFYALQSAMKVDVPGEPLPIFVVADRANQKTIESYDGPVFGADLRWTTPVKGLMAGASYLHSDLTASGIYTNTQIPYHLYTQKDNTNAYYVDYTLGNLRLDGEYRREIRFLNTTSAAGVVAAIPSSKDMRSGYLSVAYRISKWLEVGTYHSRFYYAWPVTHSLPRNHVFDQAVTARFDLRSYLDLKIEGHFMNGNENSSTVNRGFYAVSNPNGLAPSMKMAVIRLGFHM
jgi:hypothetical protein